MLHSRDLFKNVLIVDSTILAGLLILISLPVPLVIHSCDWVASLESTIRKIVIDYALWAFLFFSASAVVSAGYLFVHSPFKTKKYFEKAFETQDDKGGSFKTTKYVLKIAALYLPVELSVGGFIILFLLAYTLLTSGWIIPDSPGCMVSSAEGIGLSDTVSVEINK